MSMLRKYETVEDPLETPWYKDVSTEGVGRTDSCQRQSEKKPTVMEKV